MKKQGNGEFRTSIFSPVVMTGILLLALMVCFPISEVAAAGDQAGDVKLQAMKSDLMACMQPGDAGQTARVVFSQKYNVPLSKLNENALSRPPASDGGMDYNTAYFVCTAEYLTIAGAIVWKVREEMDVCTGDIRVYCANYSVKCDHYNWVQGCYKCGSLKK